MKKLLLSIIFLMSGICLFAQKPVAELFCQTKQYCFACGQPQYLSTVDSMMSLNDQSVFIRYELPPSPFYMEAWPEETYRIGMEMYGVGGAQGRVNGTGIFVQDVTAEKVRLLIDSTDYPLVIFGEYIVSEFTPQLSSVTVNVRLKAQIGTIWRNRANVKMFIIAYDKGNDNLYRQGLNGNGVLIGRVGKVKRFTTTIDLRSTNYDLGIAVIIQDCTNVGYYNRTIITAENIFLK